MRKKKDHTNPWSTDAAGEITRRTDGVKIQYDDLGDGESLSIVAYRDEVTLAWVRQNALYLADAEVHSRDNRLRGFSGPRRFGHLKLIRQSLLYIMSLSSFSLDFSGANIWHCNVKAMFP